MLVFVASDLGVESVLCFVLSLSLCFESVFLIKGLSCCIESVLLYRSQVIPGLLPRI